MAPRIPPHIFDTTEPSRSLTSDQEALKRQIYEAMRPRRRTFVDRIGYDNWDPFQEPNHPLDMRVDAGLHTTEELVHGFLRSVPDETVSESYRRGALDCAMGVITKDEKYRGVMDFCLWYYDLLQKEGRLTKPGHDFQTFLSAHGPHTGPKS